MMDTQKFCLKWDGFQGSVTSLFDSLRQVEELVDITICCEGQRVRAHRMMLSACSPYFRELLKDIPCQQMVIFLKDTSAADMHAIIEFMYKGSVNVAQSQLASFIKTAEMLQIRGLSGDEEKAPPSPVQRRAPPPPRLPPSPAPDRRPAPPATPPAAKRRRASQEVRPPTPTVVDCTLSPDASPAAQSAGGDDALSPRPPSQPSAAPPVVASSQPPQPQPLQSHHHHQQHEQQQPVSDGRERPDEPDPYDAAAARPAPEPVAERLLKVEKVDLTEDEDSASLEATLDHVAEYEGGYDPAEAGPYRTGALDMAGGLAAAQYNMVTLPGPSQRVGDDGVTQAPRYTCETCGVHYLHPISLKLHRKAHEGATTCSLCGRTLSMVASLRAHLRSVHRLSEEEVRVMVPTATRRRQQRFAKSACHQEAAGSAQQAGGALRLAPVAARGLAMFAADGELSSAGGAGGQTPGRVQGGRCDPSAGQVSRQSPRAALLDMRRNWDCAAAGAVGDSSRRAGRERRDGRGSPQAEGLGMAVSARSIDVGPSARGVTGDGVAAGRTRSGQTSAEFPRNSQTRPSTRASQSPGGRGDAEVGSRPLPNTEPHDSGGQQVADVTNLRSCSDDDL